MLSKPSASLLDVAAPIHITIHTEGMKMEGIVSINTSPYENDFCQAMHTQKDIVCSKCYAFKMELHYAKMRPNLIENFYRLIQPLSEAEILSTCNQIRLLNKKIVRLNSLGELKNVSNITNYYAICSGLPDVKFALYTKRLYLIRQVSEKPSNLSIIWSNPLIDSPVNKIPDGCNGVFNILSYDYCNNNKIIPNCKLECKSCLKCYSGKPVIINELLKLDQNRIKNGKLQPLTETK